MSRQCSAIKPNGERCRRLAANGNEWCSAHDEAHKEARRRAASKGGRSKGSARVQELHRRLEELADRVLEGNLETARGAVAVQAISAQIRLLEQERRFEEADVRAEFEELKRELKITSA